MNPEQIKLVQTSFEKIAPDAEKLVDDFYGRLFEIAPEVRPMFKTDMTSQKKKLLDSLALVVISLHNLGPIIPKIKDLGVKHVEYGVKDEHYDLVGDALIYSLDKNLGNDFTPELKEAWVEAYGILADTMKNAAAESV